MTNHFTKPSLLCVFCTFWKLVTKYESCHEKTCLYHMRSTKAQISAFVVHCLDSVIPLLAIAEISRLWLVSIAEQAGLSLNWSQTTKTGFLVTWLIWLMLTIVLWLKSSHYIFKRQLLWRYNITFITLKVQHYIHYSQGYITFITLKIQHYIHYSEDTLHPLLWRYKITFITLMIQHYIHYSEDTTLHSLLWGYITSITLKIQHYIHYSEGTTLHSLLRGYITFITLKIQHYIHYSEDTTLHSLLWRYNITFITLKIYYIHYYEDTTLNSLLWRYITFIIWRYNITFITLKIHYIHYLKIQHYIHYLKIHYIHYSEDTILH